MKKALVALVLVVLLLAVAYFGFGYVLYNQLADISDGCQGPAANTPAKFDDQGGYWTDHGFDFAAYAMPDYETVSFPSRQTDINISGWYVEADANAPAVILVHGLGSCKRDHNVLVPAGMLSHAGFNVLMLDVRDAGDSDFEDGRSAIGNEEYLDVLGGWDWLQQTKGIPAERIGLLGNSLGAATALIAFDQEPRLAAVFVDSPFSNLPQIIREELARNNYPQFLYSSGIVMAQVVAGDNVLAFDPEDALRHANGRPLFIIHGTADKRINVHHTERLAEVAQETGANATFWIIEGVDHVQAAADETAAYEEKLITFFTEALGQP